MNKNQIFKIYGTDYLQMTKEILEESGLADMIENKDGQIGIKPNLVSPSEASWGGTTHPEVVAGIIEYLQEHGFQKIAMLEGSWVGDKTQEAVQVCGYDKLTEKYGVPFWNRYHGKRYLFHDLVWGKNFNSDRWIGYGDFYFYSGGSWRLQWCGTGVA